MIGLILALVASFCFAISNVFVRKGMNQSGESFSAMPISVLIGMALSAFPSIISSESNELTSLSWLGIVSLAGAGVIHFVIGRMLAYTSIRLIGANRAAPILACCTFFAVALGIFFLNEPLTVHLVLAFLLLIGGVIVISTTSHSEPGKLGAPEGHLTKGIFTALGAAICWGVTPVLIKIGLEETGSSFLAVFVSYLAATIVAAGLLFHPRNYAKLRRLDRASLIPITIAATATTISQILRYVALDYSPVSMVSPLISTSALFVFPLSFLINRKIETFHPRVIAGAIAVVIGIFLMFRVA